MSEPSSMSMFLGDILSNVNGPLHIVVDNARLPSQPCPDDFMSNNDSSMRSSRSTISSTSSGSKGEMRWETTKDTELMLPEKLRSSSPRSMRRLSLPYDGFPRSVAAPITAHGNVDCNDSRWRWEANTAILDEAIQISMSSFDDSEVEGIVSPVDAMDINLLRRQTRRNSATGAPQMPRRKQATFIASF